LNEKISSLKELKGEIKQANEELPVIKSLVLNVAKDTANFKLDEENITKFVKEEHPLYGKWLKNYVKRSALNECIVQLKKAFENKNITLQELLEQTRKIHCKQFICIYVMKAIERKLHYLH